MLSFQKDDKRRTSRTTPGVPFGLMTRLWFPRMSDKRQPYKSIAGQLRCVWSGAPGEEHSCRERIPRSVPMAAWMHGATRDGMQEGFFQLTWRGEVWLAYGVADGSIRGVYCPTHCAQRAARGTPQVEAQEARPPIWAVAV
jgi:hypothetical protein